MISPGRDFAKLARSRTDFTGSDGCVTSARLPIASGMIGAKSFTGS